MEVLLLGTGSADGWPNPFCDCLSCDAAQADGVLRGQSAALVDDVLLLDCGPEAPRAALRAGRTLTGVRDVLLTHSHPDHTGPAALLWRAWARVETPLTVHGPAAALDVCRAWVGPEDPVTFHPVGPGDSFATGHHEVVALEANHGDAGSGPGLLWDLTDDHGHRLLYATDTGRPGAATMARLRAAQPYDLVVLEETFGHRSDLGQDHLDLGSFVALLADLRTAGTVGPGTQVVATHLGHHNPPPAELDRELAEVGAGAGRDGQVLEVGPVDVRPSHGGRRTLVLGGARSGKSLLAERQLHDRADVTYVATGGSRPDDPEWQERVRAHRRRRPECWTTRETTDLVGVLAEAAPGSAVLVDCLTLWLTDRLDASGAWDEVGTQMWRKELDSEVEELLQALRSSRSDVVVVSNEVGQGVVPATRSGRVFQDELGALNARVAEVADQVVVVVAGLPTTLKGHPVMDPSW